MTERIDAGTRAEHELGARDRHEEIVAAIFCQLTESDEIVRQALILAEQTCPLFFPVVPVTPERVALLEEQQDAHAIGGFPIHMKEIETLIVADAVRRIPGLSEMLAQVRDRIAESIALRLTAHVLYGIPLNLGISDR